MKKPNNWDTTSAAAEFKRPMAGGYVCIITKATDFPEKEYLNVEFDIAEGEFKGYGKDTLERAGWTPFHFNKSYKAKALSYFKQFIEAVQDTNSGFVYDFNESKLVGKGIGIVLGESEYTKKDGSIGTRLEPVAFKTANAIRSGDYIVPVLKKLTASGDAPVFADEASDDDLPF